MGTKITVVLLIMCLLAINWLTMNVVESNALAGMYPTDGDSIGIPIFGTWLATIVLSPFFFMVVWLPLSRFADGIMRKSRVHKAVLISVVALLYLLGMLLAVVGASMWADSRHWPISAAYLALAVWFAVAGVFFLGKLSNRTHREFASGL